MTEYKHASKNTTQRLLCLSSALLVPPQICLEKLGKKLWTSLGQKGITDWNENPTIKAFIPNLYTDQVLHSDTLQESGRGQGENLHRCVFVLRRWRLQLRHNPMKQKSKSHDFFSSFFREQSWGYRMPVSGHVYSCFAFFIKWKFSFHYWLCMCVCVSWVSHYSSQLVTHHALFSPSMNRDMVNIPNTGLISNCGVYNKRTPVKFTCDSISW